MEFGQRDGKMYYEIRKPLYKEYSGTGPSVIVTLGLTPYSKGPVPCSENLMNGNDEREKKASKQE